jgi:hypothetical protein
VLETALEAEISEHLGYDKHDPAGRNGGNSRNGSRTKTVVTEIGPVELDVPRDRIGSFEPVIVRKRQRRLDGIDQLVLSLTARGLQPAGNRCHSAPWPMPLSAYGQDGAIRPGPGRARRIYRADRSPLCPGPWSVGQLCAAWTCNSITVAEYRM